VTDVTEATPVARTPAPRAHPSRQGTPGEPRRVAYLYILPAFVFFAGFMAWPLLHGFWLSFFEWDGLTVGTWVGLDNYHSVLTDPELREPFLHSLILVIFFSAIPIVLGLTLAGLMMRARLRGMPFFRTVLFLPQVIAMVVVAIAWGHIYAPDGPLNDLLRTIGLDDLTHAWLGEPSWALVSVGVVGTWVGTGLCLILFLAGLSKVPRELYESARLDGAGAVREFLNVGLPALRGELAVAMTLTMIAALRTFDLVYVMTPNGGPDRSTAVPSYEVYKRAFVDGEVGTAVTVAIVLTAIILVVTIGINRFAERGDEVRL
jgi:raffinose/stachyose/melibiose transport system permease protein